ncbi:transposase [Nocardia nova]|uniref:transposase n=1 Tax=Nocardia nova TaxID=37330 RepID=UPI001C6735A9|nr:transposase [Nocardia nova]
MYAALDRGRVEIARLRRALTAVPLPRAARLAFLLADLPVAVLGRMRSDRVLRHATPPRQPGANGTPPRHGGEFVFGDPATWGEPDTVTATVSTARRPPVHGIGCIPG